MKSTETFTVSVRSGFRATPPVQWVKRHSLLAFFLLTFSLTWLMWLPFFAAARGWISFHYPPIFFLLFTYLGGPSMSALILTWLTDGWAGVATFLRSAFRWRVGLHWYAIVIFGPLLLIACAVVVYALLGGNMALDPRFSPWYLTLLSFLLAYPINIVFGGPVLEELGWRGYALPRLLAGQGGRRNALLMGALLGLIWGCWHLPLFWIPNGGSGAGFGDFLLFLGEISAAGVLLTWVYTNTRGSVLLCILLHASFNTLPYTSPDGIRTLYYIILAVFWLTCLVLALIYGPARLSRKPASELPPFQAEQPTMRNLP